jgi:hypothetical protein
MARPQERRKGTLSTKLRTRIKSRTPASEGKIRINRTSRIRTLPKLPRCRTGQRFQPRQKACNEAADGHQNINGLVKFGLFKNLELRFANNPFERDAGLAGVGDSGAGFKYRIRSQAGLLPTFSVLYTAAIPTSTATPGIGAVDHDVNLLFSKDFGKHHIDINGGVNFLGRPGASGYDRNYFTAFSYSHPVTQKLGFSAELAGFSRANASTPATMTLLFAATYNMSSRLVLDGGEYTAVYGNLPRLTGFAGVTYSIADLYHLHGARRTVERKP